MKARKTMHKVNVMGAFALAALTGLSAIGISAANVKSVGITADSNSDGVMSYEDGNGNIWCSENNGKSWISESEYEKGNPTPAMEWWTYEEYKSWLEQEKAQLQNMADEKAIVETSEGSAVWTQEMTDRIVAEHEQTLNDMKNGLRVSKSVNGDSEGMASYYPNDIATSCD